ncbi:amidohydrolase family protein [Candidatus Sumerlaeota bacterium]|nr:amidohydrolase family protein [Candidatus Sumerlaeota bacterium]
MILDGHIHILSGNCSREDFVKRLKKAGIGGGVIISLPPRSFSWVAPAASTKERLDNLFFWREAAPNLFPFFWIDPMENDALKQIDLAVKRGAAGFKIICNNFFPSDPQALKIIGEIAQRGKPILFHSGILWDGKASSAYNRPAEFEILLEIRGLKFALAHIGWPWRDELLAVYGKFQNARLLRKDSTVEMFIDITPGTPPIYRQDALTKIFQIGYDVENNVIFGSDSIVNEYNVSWLREWIKRDNAIYKKLRLSQKVVKKIYSENLKRFLGKEKM